MLFRSVLRGEDHVSNTATQLQMFVALGGTLPNFSHTALLTGSEGKLSKRLGSLGVEAFRDAGLEAITLNALLARLGTSDPVEPVTEMAPLIERFDFAHFGRAPARFDDAELATLNQKIVHLLSYEAVADRLPDAITAEVWPVIQPNLATVSEVADWLPVLTGDIPVPSLSEEDRAYLAEATAMLDDITWDDGIWQSLTGALKARTGRKGKTLFLPLRLALTGLDHGPDMARLLPIIGKDRATARIKAAASNG